MIRMGINSTLLCIHRDPAQLSLLKESGYELVTATNAPDGLRLFMSRPVDAVVLEHQLDVLEGSVLATEIKRVRPTIPIVMLVDHLELPDGALKSVDAIVAKSDGAHFLWATVHFILNVKPAQLREQTQRAQTPADLRPPRRSREGADSGQSNTPPFATEEKDAPFSPRVWQSVQDGTVQF
jgi:DNA-binding response OmpR family regulator